MTSQEMTAARPLGEATIGELRAEIAGDVLTPGDPGYEDARHVWNGMIDRRPALIVRCAGTADVATAVGFARSEGLEIAVRGGGHNVAGNATCDGGIVIDLSPMKAVEVDAAGRIAKAEGGLTWGELDAQTQPHGLATTGGLVSGTGVAGFTLGGGIGWLMRKHGLACDNLVGATIVSADGRVIRATEQENAELLWGLRGGGGNFGIVTEFEFRLHPVGEVAGGMLAWPVERAREVLAAWRDWVDGTPDELCTLAVFMYAPPAPFIPEALHGTPMLAFGCFHLDPGAAAADFEPLRALEPAIDVVGPMPYLAIQSMFDAGAPRGSRNYWRSAYQDDLGDEAIETLVAQAARMPAPMGQLHIHQLGGAMSRTPPGATAFGGRDARFLVNFVSLWLDPAQDGAGIAWAKAASEAMAPYGTGARYVNFLADEGEAGVRSAYEAETFARLQSLKAQHDPANVFHLNQNIRPA